MDIIDAFIPISLALCIFGIVYLYFTTRHREKMALIEKGLDASFLHSDLESMKQLRRSIILNIALTLIGIGVGIGVGIILNHLTGRAAVYPACIFIFAGLGLLISSMLSE